MRLSDCRGECIYLSVGRREWGCEEEQVCGTGECVHRCVCV